MKMKLKIAVLLFPIMLSACTLDRSAVEAIQEHYDLGDYVYDCPEPEPCPAAVPVVCPKPTACPVCPVISEPEQPKPQPEKEPEKEPQSFTDTFKNGTLWKPKADHDPNAVVLIEGKYKQRFDACFYYVDSKPQGMICRKWGDGKWLNGECFTNKHNGMLRQTWRARHECSKIDSVKVVCKLKGDTYIFEKQGADTCSRHE